MWEHKSLSLISLIFHSKLDLHYLSGSKHLTNSSIIRRQTNQFHFFTQDTIFVCVKHDIWTNLGHWAWNILGFLFVDKPWANTGRTYYQTFFTHPKLQCLAFLILCRFCHHRTTTKLFNKLRLGPFSIRLPNRLSMSGILAMTHVELLSFVFDNFQHFCKTCLCIYNLTN